MGGIGEGGLRSFGTVLLALAFCGAAHGQAVFPSKPIRIVISVAPGGGASETLARFVGEEMRAGLGQPVLVEFKPGANQRLAPEYVAKSPPDGYTVLIASSAQMTIFPFSNKKLNFDPVRDFVPLMHGANFRLVLEVNADTKVQNVAEFVRYAKARGKVPIGSFAAGGASHFAQVIFARATGIDPIHVPYKGSAPMKTELLGGRLDAVFDVDSSIAPLWRDGRVNILAISGTTRHPAFNTIPTFREQGLEQLDMTLWLGFFAPAGTPSDIAARLSRELQRVIALPEVRAKLTQAGMEPTGGTPQQLADIVRRDSAVWSQAVKDSGFQAEE